MKNLGANRVADPARRAAHRRGHLSEFAALCVLMLKGYRPVAQRFAAHGGEIDLIVRRGGTIVFVEVKARRSLSAAFAAIDARKRERFSRAARAWLARKPEAAGKTFRADAVFIVPGAWPKHVKDAFELNLGGKLS